MSPSLLTALRGYIDTRAASPGIDPAILSRNIRDAWSAVEAAARRGEEYSGSGRGLTIIAEPFPQEISYAVDRVCKAAGIGEAGAALNVVIAEIRGAFRLGYELATAEPAPPAEEPRCEGCYPNGVYRNNTGADPCPKCGCPF